MTDFIETISGDMQGRLDEVERQLGAFDELVQERDRLRAALDALRAHDTDTSDT